MTRRQIEDELDELAALDSPLTFVLRNGTEVRGVIASRDGNLVRLERPAGQVLINEIEKVLIEVVSEGPE